MSELLSTKIRVCWAFLDKILHFRFKMKIRLSHCCPNVSFPSHLLLPNTHPSARPPPPSHGSSVALYCPSGQSITAYAHTSHPHPILAASLTSTKRPASSQDKRCPSSISIITHALVKFHIFPHSRLLISIFDKRILVIKSIF